MVNRAPRRRASVEVGRSAQIPILQESNDLFPTFDLERNVQAGQFVALNVNYEKVQASVPFFCWENLEAMDDSHLLQELDTYT